ncbi:MAG: DNA replication/repair protein RecF [Candidatus Izemoplasmatales bacterium]|jgi:DNA replication and repair protein RecF
MIIDKITLTNFRNYQKQTLALGSGINFIIGANGEGKTNFLEAIYVLAMAKSYKVEDQDLIRFNEEFAKIQASIVNNKLKTELTLIISEIGKRALANDKEVKRLSEYIGHLYIVSFLPEDMNLIKGSPKDRRYYFDVFLGQIDKEYLRDLADYKRLVRQRNELLKKMSDAENNDETLLDVITEQLAKNIDIISKRRSALIADINRQIQEAYHQLTQLEKNFKLEYLPSITESDTSKYLKSRYRQDLVSGATNYGSHRDDYEFILDSMPARLHASQGEQRAMIIALNIALSNIVNKTKHSRPVFLLDDVFSELDQKRQNRLLECLLGTNAQTIITTTGFQDIADRYLKTGKIFRVRKGYIKEESFNG